MRSNPLNIIKYIEKKFPKELILKNISSKNNFLAERYYEHAKADAMFAFVCTKQFLKKKNKILEVGGGLHFFSNYLSYLGHQVTSVEPGFFLNYIDIMRKNSFSCHLDKNLKIIKTDLESYNKNSQEKLFDFIFSINVLEHTKNIEVHLKKMTTLIQKKKIILVRCPNYQFPFECHFYKFYIPFLPKFTFEKILKKQLIKNIGKKIYKNTLKNINFNCTYSKIAKINLNIKFLNPLQEIFKRIEKDNDFKTRLFSNRFIYLIYVIINFFKLEKLLIKIFPLPYCPYLIMQINNNNAN
jgi:2-polyprenyl-3-methyl-5-hydroxy-6-metoxy-1,4-benzoquinol methylase